MLEHTDPAKFITIRVRRLDSSTYIEPYGLREGETYVFPVHLNAAGEPILTPAAPLTLAELREGHASLQAFVQALDDRLTAVENAQLDRAAVEEIVRETFQSSEVADNISAAARDKVTQLLAELPDSMTEAQVTRLLEGIIGNAAVTDAAIDVFFADFATRFETSLQAIRTQVSANTVDKSAVSDLNTRVDDIEGVLDGEGENPLVRQSDLSGLQGVPHLTLGQVTIPKWWLVIAAIVAAIVLALAALVAALRKSRNDDKDDADEEEESTVAPVQGAAVEPDSSSKSDEDFRNALLTAVRGMSKQVAEVKEIEPRLQREIDAVKAQTFCFHWLDEGGCETLIDLPPELQKLPTTGDEGARTLWQAVRLVETNKTAWLKFVRTDTGVDIHGLKRQLTKPVEVRSVTEQNFNSIPKRLNDAAGKTFMVGIPRPQDKDSTSNKVA